MFIFSEEVRAGIIRDIVSVLEAVQSSYGTATRGDIETELQSMETTQDKVGVHE